MKNSQDFDYDRPTRESLAGIYIEASDEALDQPGILIRGDVGSSALQPAALFGLTVTADDSVASFVAIP
jgi:hypothetical protein